MNRREFLKAAGVCGASVVFGGCGNAAGPGSAWRGGRANIIFIMADDLGWGDLGCYGQQKIQTPNIDALAAEGTRFTQCYAGSTVCAPSRSVLMTGQHTGHTRIRDNSPRVGGQIEAFGEGSRRLSLKAEDITVAEVLKQAGYATGITGKWGLGEPNTDGVPTRQGFDEWLGYLNQNHAPYYYTTYLWHNEEKMLLEGNKDSKRRQYTQDVFTDFALDFVRRHKDGPFFLYVPYAIPHRRFEVPSVEPYGDKDWPGKAKIYAAMITRMDSDVGRIMRLLRELGIDDDTIVFFCSDNGAEGKPADWAGLFDSWGPFRGRKGTLYEGGLRVPMIVRWPGKVPAGKVSDAVWYFADVLPTFGELGGAQVPSEIDGVSVLGALLGIKQDLDGRFLYWELPKDRLLQAVRWGKYKAVRKGQDGPIELYDLAEDAGETNNIAVTHPEIVRRIEDFLSTAHTDSPNWPVS